MIALRPATERGHADHGWLNTYHSFSFADYYDPRHMGFRALRVINEDWVQPGRGFATHSHHDMEIITYVLEGALSHKDSMGNASVIRPGEVQRMSAGTGVRHSEFNPSANDPVHLLQIWILPSERGLTPSYEQKTFSTAEKLGKLRLIASEDGREGSVGIHQDASVFATLLPKGSKVVHQLEPNRHAYVHVARGDVLFNGKPLHAGDGAALTSETIELAGVSDDDAAEVLLFDLA
jgi:redox-sensitive bicupin YhaK (pirin superfamily)